MNDLNREHGINELIQLNKISRILFICSSIILCIENGYLLATFPNGVLAIFYFPIDAIAILIFGFVLVFEFYLNRTKNPKDFLYTGFSFLFWSVLTITWRSMLPEWVLGREEIEGGFQFWLILFFLASIWLTVSIWKFTNLLNDQTEEGKAIRFLRPKMTDRFQLIILIYLLIHQICSIMIIIGFGTFIEFTSLGILGKLIIAPILGILIYSFLPILYMNHKMADINRVSISIKDLRDYQSLKNQ